MQQHEVAAAFAGVGLALSRSLVEMLNEHVNHRTERRGCGFTQATRFLSSAINQARNPIAASDLSVFEHWPISETELIAMQMVRGGWAHGWRQFDQAPSALRDAITQSEVSQQLSSISTRLESARKQLHRMESQIFVDLLEDVLTGGGSAPVEVAGMSEKPDIGSCSQAEEYFLEIAHRRIRRGGQVNVIVDRGGAPVMLEKVNLGESHSAILVAPICICGVRIPPGGLCAIKHGSPMVPVRETPLGRAIPLASIECARFLRLTTLSVAPEVRMRAFGPQVEAQVRADMFSPLTTTIQMLQDLARAEIARAR